MTTALKVVILPPGPAPVELTAKAPVANLHEHFLAFLNANNPRGFQAEELAVLGEATVGELMQLVSTSDWLTESRLKDVAKQIKKASGGVLTHMRTLELISALFGYANWHQARIELTRAGVLSNLRHDRSALNIKIFNIAYAKAAGDSFKSS